MNTADRVVVGILAGLMVAISGRQAYLKGVRDGELKESYYYERVIADRVDKGVAGFRRVQAMRESSEHDRGFQECLQQF